MLAPRAAGKSHGARLGRWVDGDIIIHNTVGWPAGDWWKTPNADFIHERNARVLTEAAWRAPAERPGRHHFLIAFNGNWPRAAGVLPPVLVVVPTEDYINANLATHPHALRDATYEARMAETASNIAGLIAIAREWACPILTGVDANEFMRASPSASWLAG
jgi:hypothetical protein